MTKLKEDQELKAINDAYAKAVALFRKRDFRKGHQAFGQIIDEYKNSEFFSVLEIQTRAKVYHAICQDRLQPEKTELKSPADYLLHGTVHLNAGRPDEAIAMFRHLEGKKSADGHLYYLLALAHLQKGDVDASLAFLEKAVKTDDGLKVVVYNEPDFESLHQNPRFSKLVE